MAPLRDRLAERGLLEMAERIAREHQVTVMAMFHRRRGFAAVANARHQMMAELYATGHWSYPRLGQLFGRDHTSVMEGVKKAAVRAIRESGREVA
jgi:chromosomal replication initiation ATPase DnaA